MSIMVLDKEEDTKPKQYLRILYMEEKDHYMGLGIVSSAADNQTMDKLISGLKLGK